MRARGVWVHGRVCELPVRVRAARTGAQVHPDDGLEGLQRAQMREERGHQLRPRLHEGKRLTFEGELAATEGRVASDRARHELLRVRWP